MAKIPFQKVEQTISEAVHYSFVKKLTKGEPVAYPRAVSFFGVETTKPNFQDSVITALSEWKNEVLDEGIARQQEEMITETPHQDTLLPASTVPSAEEVQASSFTEPPQAPPISSMYIFRKRLLWFVKHRVANIYKLLGTTKEEVIALRQKKELTPKDQERIQELLTKSNEINQRLMKKLGFDTDEALIELEKQRHIRKRLNIKESWLPL